MSDIDENNGSATPPDGMRRRGLMRGLGLGAVGVAAMGAMGSKPARADSTLDYEIINFALNLEYLEAEFYLNAVLGHGLASGDTTGTGRQGTVGGSPTGAVPFKNPAIAAYAQRLAVDEQTHVQFLRSALVAAGQTPVAEPYIDVGVGPNNSFSQLAVAAGIINAGEVFNPYADDVSFLLGASIFEDVGVTAYGGAIGLISNPAYASVAANIMAVEAYHSGAIRALLANIGAGVAFDKIATLRATLSAGAMGGGVGGEQPILIDGNNYNFLPTDFNALAFNRTTNQVLAIVYAGGKTEGLFFPAGMNGAISAQV